MVVYLARNKKNNMVYVGATIRTLVERKREHERKARNGSFSAFHNAIREYGADNFDWSIIDTASTATELNEKEKRWIAHYSATDGVYNKLEGGNAAYDEETRQRISNSLKGKFAGENNPMYGRVGEMNPFYGKTHTEEARRKMAEANTGANNPSAKINDMQAAFIRMLTPAIKTRENRDADFSQGEISEWFGVSSRQVRGILNGKSWLHLGKFEELRDEFRRLYEESRRGR
ncbi:NUMOD3 domain-containing DNA-binding protein [Thermoactinomyces sp. CICC 10522]|uniref:NUMOD3 domain-containing DNA-binding protein n=1 Tax=Thermoactinomyces sp. CICC 10522 TaxID=2767427 RepID=UPI0018DC29BF|nr:NUMOD3 domain-containing DNA-binding protein [Thermoactinomyces sp. CICC 10522]MBH8603663.1 GIY-YIG nuclease family protein [Thermoactinomyces sp. CICC 10522]